MFAQHGSESILSDDAGERLATLPILVLNVHSRCNCRCLMCDIWKREESNEITAADLERHRQSLLRLRVEWVVLSGGEPLMNRDLRGLCTLVRDLGIRVTLLTTGLLLERRTIDVADLFDDVIISLDGPREIHDAVRRVKGAFDLIQSGVSSVRKRRPAIGITARTTVQKTNHAHLRETALGAKEIGLDGISFLAADLISVAFNRPLLWLGERQSEVGLSESEVEVLADEVEALIAWDKYGVPGHYVAESPAKLRRIVQHFRAHLGRARVESPKCNAPWVSAVVESDGTVRPCFFHRPIGSIASTDLEEIINGETARAFRRDLDVQRNPICQRCVCSLYRDRPFRT